MPLRSLEYDRRLQGFARSLRRDMTPQERKLWYFFLRSYPQKFYRQRIIGPYIVDFYCASARLVIEIDGSQHYTETGERHDHERSQTLRSFGLKVLRFTNPEIDQSFEAVCAEIDRVIQSDIKEEEFF